MGNLFEYEIPVLHPFAVHFPIGLLLCVVVAAVPWTITGRDAWRVSMLVMLSLGTAGVAFAYFTGEAMEEAAEGSPIVEELVELHESLGLAALIASVVILLLVFGMQTVFKRGATPGTPTAFRVAACVLVVALAVLVAFTGHVGGIMVWGVAR